MSLDKAIEHGKEHRKPYRGSKRFDVTCRNHGSCPWCNPRLPFKHKKERIHLQENLPPGFTPDSVTNGCVSFLQ